MVSKALVVSAYRQKLVDMTRLGADVVAVVPAEWREGGGRQLFEHRDDDVHTIVARMRWNGHFHLHYYPDLPDIIRRVRPDVVHIDEEPYNRATYAAARSCRAAGIPSLFYTYQNLMRRYPPPFHQMERHVYQVVARGLAASAEAATVLRAKGFARPITVVPQFGVDPDIFCPGPPSAQPFTVGFPNRLIPGKAPHLSLEALDMLPRDVQLRIVGDGPLRAILQAEIERRGLARRVTVQPRVVSTAMPELMRSFDVVILPSITTSRWKEQFGRVLVEAMACAVPVVGSDSGEIPQVIGDAGIIFPEGRSGALAEAIGRLYTDPSLRCSLGQKGRERVLRLFTHRSIAERTLAAYQEVLAG